MMSQKVIFLHCPDMTLETVNNLLDELSDKMDSKEYLFIASDKEIRAIDKDELLKALQ